MSHLLGLFLGILFLIPANGFCKEKKELSISSEKRHVERKFPQFVKRAFGYASYTAGSEALKVCKGECIPVYLTDNPTNIVFDAETHTFIIKIPGFYLIRYTIATPPNSQAYCAIGSDFLVPATRYAPYYPPGEPKSTPEGEPLPYLAETNSSWNTVTREVVRYLNKETKVQLGVTEGALDHSDSLNNRSLIASLYLQKLCK